MNNYLKTLKIVSIVCKDIPEDICHLVAQFDQEFDLSKSFITEKGKLVIKEITNVIYAYEDKSHDGYDCMGPKSYLWSLYVFHMVNKKIVATHYHWENWFQSTCDTDTYELYENSKIYHEWKKNSYIPRKISASEINPESPGSPIDANIAIMKIIEYFGS